MNYRSSWVLAGIRIAMIALFALWVLLGARQTPDELMLFAACTGAYFLLALFLFYCALFQWWLDYRLALPSLVIDAAAFWAALVFTQQIDFDAFSPFITFFAFLVICAGARWSQKPMPAMVIALGLLFGLAGVLLYDFGSPINLEKLPRRFSYLVVLAVILSWFAAIRGPHGRPVLIGGGRRQWASPLDRALAFAMEACAARGAALVWSTEDEPRSKLRFAGMPGSDSSELAPGTIDEPENLPPMLFDRDRQRRLYLGSDGKIASGKGTFDAGLADHAGIPQGISLPVCGNLASGQLVLTGISLMNWEDIWVGLAAAKEVATSLDDEEAGALSRALALTRVRAALARDLHDSLAQSLAGARFRLEALRARVARGTDIDRELEKVAANLQSEQDNVRSVIGRLRSGATNSGEQDLAAEMARLAIVLSQQWDAAVEVTSSGSPPRVCAELAYSLQQLAREAVANAVRHGKATRITLHLDSTSRESLLLVISDDGEGIAGAGETTMPRTISERAEAMGGELELRSSDQGTVIELRVPAGAAS